MAATVVTTFDKPLNILIEDPNTQGAFAAVVVPGSGQNSTAKALQTTAIDTLTPVGGPSFSATSAAVLFSLDTTGYDTIHIQVMAAGTGCTIVYEGSNDNINWITESGSTTNGSVPSAATSSTSTGAFVFPNFMQFFRARVSIYGSATITVIVVLRATPPPNSIVSAAFSPSPGSNTVNKTRLMAGSSLNAVLLKTGSGRIYNIITASGVATARYLKIYDTSATPNVGTDIPSLTITIPGSSIGGQPTMFDSVVGICFTHGIGLSMTAAFADTDTTGTSIGDANSLIGWI